jgi:hypothetical protein
VAESISPKERETPVGRQIVKTTVAAQNDQAMADLSAVMSGVRKKR